MYCYHFLLLTSKQFGGTQVLTWYLDDGFLLHYRSVVLYNSYSRSLNHNHKVMILELKYNLHGKIRFLMLTILSSSP